MTSQYFQTLPLSRELREAVYSGVASKAMSYNAILQLMGNVKWEIRELMSEPNSYVYVMLQVCKFNYSHEPCLLRAI